MITTNKIKPMIILNYSNINGCGHYNIMHIKKINNIKENILNLFLIILIINIIMIACENIMYVGFY